MYDIILVALPGLDKDKPSPGIFYLKSYLEQHNKKVKCIDGNQLDSMAAIIDEINKYDFKWLGISVFSLWQKEEAISLGSKFKNVIYGGAEVMHDWDHGNFIAGEGELALLEFLNGNMSYPGINGLPPQQIKDINSLPRPDYVDVTKQHNYKNLVLTGSRGCVRNCTFCNVRKIWKKYRYIDGAILAEMMKTVVKETGVKEISLSDSLVNGADREFKKMCLNLIGCDVKWKGQFIIKRNKDEEYYKLVKDSGCNHLSIGVESGSEAIRDHMNKIFTNDDLHFALDMLIKYKIKMTLLLIVGYPTETEDDFNETLALLDRYKNNTDLIRISPHLMHVIKDTPISEQTNLFDEFGYAWKNSTLTYEMRLERFLRLYDSMETNNYNITEYVDGKRQDALKHLNNLDLVKLEDTDTWK